jgi:hypothetical protein
LRLDHVVGGFPLVGNIAWPTELPAGHRLHGRTITAAQPACYLVLNSGSPYGMPPSDSIVTDTFSRLPPCMSSTACPYPLRADTRGVDWPTAVPCGSSAGFE